VIFTRTRRTEDRREQMKQRNVDSQAGERHSDVKKVQIRKRVIFITISAHHTPSPGFQKD